MPRGRAPSPTANRTDLNQPAPITAAPNQPYGERAQQIASQHAIPMAGAPTVQPNQPPAGPADQPSPPSAGQPGPNELQAMTLAHNGPGDSLNLMRPTERPNEPVTHGLPSGPGGGPETLTGVGAAAREGAVDQATLKNLLTNMAAMPGSTAAIQDLAARAQSGAA